MSATPQDVQAKIDAGTLALSKTTKTYPAMVKAYGRDTTKWPQTNQWGIAEKAFADARSLAGQIVVVASPPTAAFTYKEN